MNDISTPSTIIAAEYKRWKQNRDLITGSAAVKTVGAGYLPRLPIHDKASFTNADDAYLNYLKRSNFFPASSRILEGLMGLIFRKPVKLKASTSLTPIFDTITRDGDTVADLAERVVEEVMTTNFCGLFVDHPVVHAGASKAQAERSGARPFVTLYPAESILEVTPAVVNNRRKITRVRLVDNTETIRELLLVDGVYTVIIHDLINGIWTARDPIVPLRSGKAIDEIPFHIISTKARAIVPKKAVMDDVCELNIELFQAQAASGNSLYYCANPILTIKGVSQTDIPMSAGAILFFPQHSTENPVEIDFTEYQGAGQNALDGAVGRIKDELSAIGSRIISPDTKAGVETAEAMALRKANQDSVLASQARTIARGIADTLNIVAVWAGATEPVEFELSTDFMPAAMTAQDRAAVVNEWMKGLYSHETALNLFKDGEILPDTFDVEAEIEKVSSESLTADRPLNLPADDVNGTVEDGGE